MTKVPTYITSAVEGLVDDAVAVRLIRHVGAEPGPAHGRGGKAYLRARIGGFANAARFAPWLVLVDLDADFDCAAALVSAWLPDPPPMLCLRVAVVEVEAWLLADRERVASFLNVDAGLIPAEPDSESDPKRTLVDLARRSPIPDLREDLVPAAGSYRTEGRGYASQVAAFARGQWRPQVAAHRSDSLARAVRCLERLASAATP